MNATPVAQALARLASAIDRLEAASLRQRESERIRMNLETELALMRTDRQGLADALDEALARGETLQANLMGLQPRLDRAIEVVRGALGERD